MGNVSEIVVPLPSVLTTVAGGADSHGQAYTLHMPNVVTEPMSITSGGHTFTWKPTELVYTGFDASSTRKWDYLVGSSPSTVATREREARYTRVYPSADDVFLAKSEEVKHFTILHAPMRLPAEYITSGAEFGVSGIIGGVPLPTGYHDAIDAFGFTLPVPVAKDLEGCECVGRYEVLDGDAGQTLYVWFDATWMANATYPVTIDPTVVVSNSTATDGRRIVQLSTGRQVSFVNTASGVVCYVSDDSGGTWNVCTSPASGIVCANTNAFVVSDSDADGTIHLLVGSNSATQPLYYVNVQVSGLTATVVQTQVEGAAGANFYWARPELVVSGSAGTPKTLTVAYLKYNANGTNTQVLYARTATVTTAGVLTLNTRNSVASNAESGQRFVFALSKRADGTVKLMYQQATPISLHVVSGISGTISNTTVSGTGLVMVGLVGVDGFSECYWIGRTSSDLMVDKETGHAYSIQGSTYGFSGGNSGHTATGDAANNRIILFVRNSTTGYPKRLEYVIGSGPTDKGDLNSTIAMGATSGISSPRNWTGRIPVLYSNGTNIYSDNAVYNVAPSAPTITMASSAFAASVGTDITITHNDTDQMSAWTLKYVLGSVTKWWNNTTKAFDQASEYWNAGSGFSASIAAADLANKLETGNVYQFYAATKDSQSVVGPYNSVAILANVGATPNVTVTSGATSNSPNYLVEWTTDQAQGAYQVRVLNGASEVSTTGKVTDSSARARSVSLPTNAVTYTIEVTCWDQTLGGGVASTPATKSVATSFTPVATPTMSVNPLSDGGYIGLTWTSPTPWANLLTANQSSAETNTTGMSLYAPAGSTNLSRDTTIFHSGAASFRAFTNQAVSSLSMFTTAPYDVPVTPGQAYTFHVMGRRANAGQLRAYIEWHDAGGANIGATGNTTVDAAAGTWTPLVTTGVAPANAAYGRPLLAGLVMAANEYLWWDTAMCELGSVAHDWILGGTQNTPTCSYVELYRKEGSGSFLRVATQLPASGSYPDFNTASGVTYSYFVRAVGDNATVADSAIDSGSIAFTSGLWLHDTVDPQSTCHFFNYRDNELQETRKPASAEFRLAGRSGPVVQFNKTMQDRNISLKVYLDKTTTDKDALLALYNADGTLCLRDGRGRKVFGVIRELPTTDQLWGTVADLSFFGVSYVESV